MSRKRMSVGRAEGSSGGSGEAAGTRSLVDAGLDQLFTTGTKAYCALTVTDRLKEKKEFASEKDRVEMLPPGADADELKQWITEKAGFACKKGAKPESANQDSMSVVVVDTQLAMYGVYDGHGPNGHDASDLALQTMCNNFLQDDKRKEKSAAVLKQVFLDAQNMLIDKDKSKEKDFASSGTTCTIVYHDLERDELVIAHVGDSRCIVAKTGGSSKDSVVHESRDHKPDLPDEKKRIESANPPGRVIFDGYFNHRVFSQKGMYPGLNMSRALGDLVAHREAGLTAEPEIHTINLKEHRGDGELFLLVCSDGVWEFMTNENVVKYLPTGSSSSGALQNAVEKLTKASYKMWMDDSDGEITDDITAIMVRL